MRTVEIRIKGHIDKDWTEWLENFTIAHVEDGETILAGMVPDEAALYGLIAKLRDLGMTLLSVNLEKEG